MGVEEAPSDFMSSINVSNTSAATKPPLPGLTVSSDCKTYLRQDGQSAAGF